MRLKKSLQHVLLFAVIISIVFQCYPAAASAAPAPKKGGTINAAVPIDLASTDPHVGSSPVNAVVMNHIYETLVGFGEKMEFVPILAERWDISKDLQDLHVLSQEGKALPQWKGNGG